MSLKNTIQYIEANKRDYLQKMKEQEQQAYKTNSQHSTHQQTLIQAAKLK
jgi:hypothetical protein